MPLDDRNTFQTGNGKRNLDNDFRTALTQVESTTLSTTAAVSVDINAITKMFLALADEDGDPRGNINVRVDSTIPLLTVNATNMSIFDGDTVVVATLTTGESVILGRYALSANQTSDTVVTETTPYTDSDMQASYVTCDIGNVLGKGTAYMYNSIGTAMTKFINTDQVAGVIPTGRGICHRVFDGCLFYVWNGELYRYDPATTVTTKLTNTIGGPPVLGPIFVYNNVLYFLSIFVSSTVKYMLSAYDTIKSGPSIVGEASGWAAAYGYMWLVGKVTTNATVQYKPIDYTTAWTSVTLYSNSMTTSGGVLKDRSDLMAIQPDGSLWILGRNTSTTYRLTKFTKVGALPAYNDFFVSAGFTDVTVTSIATNKNNVVYACGHYLSGSLQIPAVWKIAIGTSSVSVTRIWDGFDWATATSTAHGLHVHEDGTRLVWWAGNNATGGKNSFLLKKV